MVLKLLEAEIGQQVAPTLADRLDDPQPAYEDRIDQPQSALAVRHHITGAARSSSAWAVASEEIGGISDIGLT